MAEEATEVLVLKDHDGNVYAVPRRLLQRTRVPDELKNVVSSWGINGSRPFGRFSPLAELGSSPPGPVQMAMQRRLPWAVGWFRIPPR